MRCGHSIAGGVAALRAAGRSFRVGVPELPATTPPARSWAGRGSGGAVVHTEIEAGVLTVAIVGEVDLAGARTLGDALTEAVDALGPPTSVLLDLRATTYLASAGVALLAEVAARARRRGHRVDARSEPGSAVGRVLALSGLDGVLTERPV